MVELHAHLLPGVDDGPSSMDEAIELGRAFVKDGVRGVVATPHVFPGRFDNQRRGIESAVAELAAEFDRLGLPLRVRAGGEVRVSEQIPDMLARGELPYVGEWDGRPVLLLEMPDQQVPVGMERLLAWLAQRGIQALIAHPERNRAIRQEPVRAQALVDSGALLQVTAAAVLGEFGPHVEQSVRYLLERDWVAMVASDAHGLVRRAPRLSAARRWLAEHYSEEKATLLTETVPARVAGFDVSWSVGVG